MIYRPLSLFAILAVLVSGCGSDTPLPPLTGKREGLVIEERFSMEDAKRTEHASSPFVAQIGCLHQDWPQYYHDETHHLSALKASLGSNASLKQSAALLSKGKFQAMATEGAAPSPVSWNRRVYFLKGTTLYEGTLQQGNFVLQRTQELSESDRVLDRDGMGGIAIRNDGVAFITLNSCEVVCVCLKTQRILWRVDLENTCSGAPTLGKDTIICVTRRNQTVALRQKDGQVAWNHQGNVEEVGLWGGSTSAISKGIVISHYSSNQVVALDEHTGDLIWSQTFAVHKGNQGKIPHHKASPVCVDELVYVLTHSNMVCLVAQSGQVLWQWPVGGHDSPLVVGHSLCFVDQHGVFNCLDRQTGKIRWTYTLPPHKEDQHNAWIGPWYVNGKMWVWRYDGLMVVFNPENLQEKAQRIPLGHPLSTSGVLVPEGFIVQTDDGGVISWNLSQ
jgi:outer membrane protein assembly factor BamB